MPGKKQFIVVNRRSLGKIYTKPVDIIIGIKSIGLGCFNEAVKK